MDTASFHRSLFGGDPTPEQLKLYQSKAHGFSNDAEDEAKFIATFVLGLFQTRDWEANTFRNVVFAVPRPHEKWVLGRIQWIVGILAAKRAGLPKSRNKMLVEAINNLQMGSRVYSVATEPPRWVSYGFKKEGEVPEWLRQGLL